MVDELWPEFDAYLRSNRTHADRLFTPIDGRAAGRPNYAWSTDGFSSVRKFPMFVLRRSIASRKLSQQGAQRQKANLHFRRALALEYARALEFRDEHLVVAQEILPFLHEGGVLLGRSYDVLITSLPLRQMERCLDHALSQHPTSRTLGDFRAPAALLDLEDAALGRARRLVTPHAEVASLDTRSVLIPWSRSVGEAATGGSSVIFPAATLGRKGAYELRECAEDLHIPLTLAGPVLEAPDFWRGVQTTRLAPTDDWLADAALVVLPSFLENRPRRLLEALDRRVPVIATPACGLPPQDGLTIVPAGDSAALLHALRALLPGSPLPVGGTPE